MPTRSLAALVLCSVLAACDSPSPPAAVSTSKDPAPREVTAKGLTFESPKRLVAFGDVHGDLDATKRALKLGGAIDDSGSWIGGDLFVVQTGDQLDRGDDDRAILDLFERLTAEAKQKGGTFLALNGNHEIMNAQLDFRYVTEGSNPPFAEFASSAPPAVSKVPEAQRGRAAAFVPGGPYAKKMAERPVVAIVGDSVFVHGGVLPKHLDYGLEKLDGELRAWLRGEAAAPPSGVVSEDGLVWARTYSTAVGPEECATLARVLGALGKKRMVMGHTPQRPGISAACDDKAWRIDTGMSRHYGGPVQVLEISGDQVRVLKE
ncbi:MAG: metallophosphoesterase [Myxococcales bacterium]|nr:metallophosphoesterase [Myxococcales bacterium]